MKKFFSEFKTFIMRGNVLDMAVGVIVGGAFTAIVNALSNNILRPLINALLALILGGNDALEKVYTVLVPAYTGEGANRVLDLTNSIYIDWGAFISAIINFILIAIVLFCIVKAINAANEGVRKGIHKYDPLTKEEIAAYRKEGKKNAEILALAKEKESRLAEEARIAEEEAAKNAPKTEAQLLEEIAELLKAKQGK
ncbi:MAG: large conductance mechanosensitive channel protein MscL [Firmicutes bacterium]|nr:large conductance mechanosensitive channel protein MscL [Bacillota bacterium]